MGIDPWSSSARLRSRFPAMIGLSLALHVLALAWVQGPGRPRLPLPTHIDATLRLSVSAAASALPSGSGTVKAPLPARRAGSAASPPTAPRRLDPEPTPAPAAAPAVVAAPPAVAQEPAPAPPPAAAGPLDQASLLARYGSRLADLLARQQDYPRLALLRGWEGEVRLRLRVARRGNLVAVNLDRSSGFEVLDQHALALVQHLSDLPPLPEGLEVSEIQVVVPINYRLRKAA